MRRFTLTLSALASILFALGACDGDDDTGMGGSGATGSTTSDTGGTGGTGGGQGGAGGQVGAGGQGGAGGGQANPGAGQDWTRDILSTALELDLATLTGRATIALVGSTSTAASFEIGDLEITSVQDASGGDLNHEVIAAMNAPRRLDVGVPSTGGPATLIIEYTFKPHTEFDGWMPDMGVSFLWPYFCGNLFPCKSDPADGLTFTMTVTGATNGMTAVYPAAIPADAPSYMPAIAVAEYTKLDLGATTAGTQLSVWHLPGQETDAMDGAAHLVDVFEFYETTYGEYSFGDQAGSVSSNWGGGDFGGMEHHPYWHISSGSLYSEEIHAHEAAHGWFGNGVRIACWEDFVLSEGTTSYIAAHALEQVGVDIWADYECTLKDACDPASGKNTIALPDTCNQIDLLNDPLWSVVPYMKGAYFFRAVGQAIGVAVLDEALAEFYTANVSKAARMQDLIDHIKTKSDDAGDATVDQLATAWLRTLECPVDYTTLCPN